MHSPTLPRVVVPPAARQLGRGLLAAAASLAVCASAASAQTPRVEGPFSGLFGGNPANRQILQQFDLRGSLFGVYQEVLEPSESQLRDLDPRFQRSGTFGGASGGASYQYQRIARRASFFTRANASGAQYTVSGNTVAVMLDASSGFTSQLSKQISFGVSGSAGYAPFYNFNQLTSAPGSLPNAPIGSDQILPGAGFGFGAAYEPNVNLGASTNLSANLTRKSRLSVMGDYRTIWLTKSHSYGYDTAMASANYSYSITRQLSVRAGYRREISTLGSPGGGRQPSYARNGFEVGVDYGDALTLALGRRTTLRVAPSASVVRWNNSTYFRVNGSASLTYNFARSWTAAANYTRDLGFMIGFTQPILSDTAGATLAGMLAKRVRLTNGVSWTHGRIGFGDAPTLNWYTASSSLSVAVNRRIAIFSQYSYSVYDVPPGSWSLVSVSRFARQAVNVGLTAYVPVFSTGRTRR
ncbi:MAG: hypothetical protein JSU08_06415 [Acidobacteria bacterium]|nr:hypothetical protein [Acidobacteriota bacterium]